MIKLTTHCWATHLSKMSKTTYTMRRYLNTLTEKMRSTPSMTPPSLTMCYSRSWRTLVMTNMKTSTLTLIKKMRMAKVVREEKAAKEAEKVVKVVKVA